MRGSKDLLELIQSATERPAMYVGQASLERLVFWLDGYETGEFATTKERILSYDFRDWLVKRYSRGANVHWPMLVMLAADYEIPLAPEAERCKWFGALYGIFALSPLEALAQVADEVPQVPQCWEPHQSRSDGAVRFHS